ncbi:MAG: dihydropteroate synthase [Lachnospiraceae bacterium]|nr:dihydropteroate synthase [Lachnospiraceae bacterium]
MIIGNKEFHIGRKPYVMGILNVTPDSFSDGGNYTDMDRALFHVQTMIEEGADIIDVGGESTRPGHVPVSVQEEIERTCFVIEAIKERFSVPVSLDTYKYEVAKTGLAAGADMINDIWGLKWDDRMAALIAEHDVPCCLMHNRKVTEYADYLPDVIADLKESISIAQAAGIRPERIMTDPGIGFAKDTNQNLLLMNHLELLTKLGYPVLLGTSRKSMIGNVLNLPVSEREEGTIATSVLGLMKGCSFFRVHNVKANVRALKMTAAMLLGKL